MAAEKANYEIDLGDVFKAIGNFFSGIGNSFIRSLASLRKVVIVNRVLFVSTTLFALVGSVIFTQFLRKDHYKSSMILSSVYLNYSLIENSIDKLNAMCEEKNRTVLAKTLNLDSEAAKNILKFEFKSFTTQEDLIEMALLKEQLNNLLESKKEAGMKLSSKIALQNSASFEITVKALSPEVIENLEQALVSYFKQNDFIKKDIEIVRVNLTERRKKLVAESKELDSLKKLVYSNFLDLAKQSRGSNNVILGEKQLTDPLTVLHEDLALNEKILEIDRELFLLDYTQFKIVDRFTAFRKPENFSIVLVMAISVAISIVLSFLIIALIKFNNYLDKIPV